MKNYLSVVAFLAFFSIQALAQKASHETSTYEVYAWALANIKDWDKLVYWQEAPQPPIFYEHGSVDTIITFDPVTFEETVRTEQMPPTDPAKHALAMKAYEQEKNLWDKETKDTQRKIVFVRTADYQHFTTSTPQYFELYSKVDINTNNDKKSSIDLSKLPSLQGIKYLPTPEKDLVPYYSAGILGFSEVFFNPAKTTAIFTLEESVYKNSRKKRFSTYLLVKKNGKWEMATMLGRKEE